MQPKRNGILTTNHPPRFPHSAFHGVCNLKYIEKVRDRRFPIVDEIRDLVLGVVCFDIPGRPPASDGSVEREITAQLAHRPRTFFLYKLFKIKSGLVRDIEDFMYNAP